MLTIINPIDYESDIGLLISDVATNFLFYL